MPRLSAAATCCSASSRSSKPNAATGSIAADKYAARRQRLVTELEGIYGELDEASPGPQGGGEGLAA